ncbi:MAG: hypothetical protein ACREQN_10780 [Candidatus Binataceae bacterium]
MNADLMDVALINDAASVATVCAEARADGNLLICHGCGDVEALITGILVVDDTEEAWVLCGLCMRKLPLHGSVV